MTERSPRIATRCEGCAPFRFRAFAPLRGIFLSGRPFAVPLSSREAHYQPAFLGGTIQEQTPAHIGKRREDARRREIWPPGTHNHPPTRRSETSTQRSPLTGASMTQTQEILKRSAARVRISGYQRTALFVTIRRQPHGDDMALGSSPSCSGRERKGVVSVLRGGAQLSPAGLHCPFSKSRPWRPNQAQAIRLSNHPQEFGATSGSKRSREPTGFGFTRRKHFDSRDQLNSRMSRPKHHRPTGGSDQSSTGQR